MCSSVVMLVLLSLDALDGAAVVVAAVVVRAVGGAFLWLLADGLGMTVASSHEQRRGGRAVPRTFCCSCGSRPPFTCA
eukprot:2011843-Alexandrium_andersonii.AAC.1